MMECSPVFIFTFPKKDVDRTQIQDALALAVLDTEIDCGKRRATEDLAYSLIPHKEATKVKIDVSTKTGRHLASAFTTRMVEQLEAKEAK